MNSDSNDDRTLEYKRCRFATRLPRDRRYSPMHYWMVETSPGLWRVGLTTFASWRLGDIVEFDFSVVPGAALGAGDEIGSIEGLKALIPLFAAGSGVFVGEGAALRQDVTLVQSDPFGAGWLYEFEGAPGDEVVDVDGYAALLDATIDLLRGHRTTDGEPRGPDDEC